MRKCILVKEQGGTYEIQPDAEREDWTEALWEARVSKWTRRDPESQKGEEVL